jgi:hypothetical protein
MTVKVGFVKHPFKSIGKASGNITGAMSQGINDVFISPITDLTKNFESTASDFLSSPILMVGVGLLGVIVISGIFKGSEVAKTGLENPESIRALAQAMR